LYQSPNTAQHRPSSSGRRAWLLLLVAAALAAAVLLPAPPALGGCAAWGQLPVVHTWGGG
jgi:hypothetical protein